MKRRSSVLVLSAALAASGCSDAPVSRLTEHMARAELERAAGAGYPARVALEGTTSGNGKPGEDETLLVLDARSVHVVPSRGFTPFTAAGFEEWLFRVWVAPYLAVSDMDGAYRAAVRGYVHALEDQRVLSRGGPLPPLPSPNEWGFTFPSHNADWGLPLSLAVFALCVVVQRFSRPR